jgi:hypothetical protein
MARKKPANGNLAGWLPRKEYKLIWRKVKEYEMYAIIGMGEESQNIEIPCMFFETQQAAEGYFSQIPWLQRYDTSGFIFDDGAEDPIIYAMPERLSCKLTPVKNLWDLREGLVWKYVNLSPQFVLRRVTFVLFVVDCFYRHFNLNSTPAPLRE